MQSRNDLIQYVADAAANPKVAAGVSTATIGIGTSTYLEWISKGFGIAASAAGVALAIALFMKAKAEYSNTKLVAEKLRLEIDQLKEK